MPKKIYWKWVCEFCFKQSNHFMLPAGWDLVWQSAVCPDCQKRVANDGGYFVVKGGTYAGTRRDPRAQTNKVLHADAATPPSAEPDSGYDIVPAVE